MPAKEILYDDAYLESLEALDILDETVEFDPDAEYNRPAPPIPDGIYQGVASNAGVYVDGNSVPYRSAQWKNEHKPHFEMNVKVDLISDDPLIDKKFIYTGFPLTTTPDPERGNASGISAAYRAITGKPIPGMPGLAHCKLLDAELQSSPIVTVRVQNALRDAEVEKTIGQMGQAVIEINGVETTISKRPKTIYGQAKIMALKGGKDSSGKFTGAADHPETGNRCVARAQIAEFKVAKKA